jgi:hypothetical protein
MTASCDHILRHIRLVKLDPPPAGAEGLMALFLTDRSVLFTSPTLIDCGGIVHLPMLVSKFDLNVWGRISLPGAQYDQLLSGYEKWPSKLNMSVFEPMSMENYNNRRHFTSNDSLSLLQTDTFAVRPQFFAGADLPRFEREYAEGGRAPASKQFELFALYRDAEALARRVSLMNAALELMAQKRAIVAAQASLLRHARAVAGNFFAKTVAAFRIDGRRPLAFVCNGLAFLAGIHGERDEITLPFLAQMLNRVPSAFAPWATPPMVGRFAQIVERLAGDCEAELVELAGPRLCRTALKWLGFGQAPLGQRMLGLIEFLACVEVIGKRTRGCQPLGVVRVIGAFFIAARNPILLETLLFLDRVFFNTECSHFFDIGLRAKWCKLTQGLWFVIADDDTLTRECRDLIIV